MITRAHQKGDAASVAVYSDCEAYRYALTREWAVALASGAASRPSRGMVAASSRMRLL